jgi:hypothetical protein
LAYESAYGIVAEVCVSPVISPPVISPNQSGSFAS